MTRHVIWSRDALDDLKHQLTYIAMEDPVAASKLVDRLRETAAKLEHFATGRPSRVPGTYEKSVGGLPYIITYELASNAGTEAVAILRVIHTARDWPVGRWPAE